MANKICQHPANHFLPSAMTAQDSAVQSRRHRVCAAGHLWEVCPTARQRNGQQGSAQVGGADQGLTLWRPAPVESYMCSAAAGVPCLLGSCRPCACDASRPCALSMCLSAGSASAHLMLMSQQPLCSSKRLQDMLASAWPRPDTATASSLPARHPGPEEAGSSSLALESLHLQGGQRLQP